MSEDPFFVVWCFERGLPTVKHPFRARAQVFPSMPMVAMGRVGKKAAGALLDGREWREMPR